MNAKQFLKDKNIVGKVDRAYIEKWCEDYHQHKLEESPTPKASELKIAKELVEGIFGKEASEDSDIVKFYADVNSDSLQTITKELRATQSKEECANYARCTPADGEMIDVSMAKIVIDGSGCVMLTEEQFNMIQSLANSLTSKIGVEVWVNNFVADYDSEDSVDVNGLHLPSTPKAVTDVRFEITSSHRRYRSDYGIYMWIGKDLYSISSLSLEDAKEKKHRLESAWLQQTKAVTDGEIENVIKHKVRIWLSDAFHTGRNTNEASKKYLDDYAPQVVALISEGILDMLSDRMREQQGEGWISVEDALPPLAPREDCYKEFPFSIVVFGKFKRGTQCDLIYDFTHRSWLEPDYELDLEEDFDDKVTHWRVDPPKGLTDKQ